MAVDKVDVLCGFEDFRQDFLENFSEPIKLQKVEAIRASLGRTGIKTSTPVAIVPFEQHALEQAMEVVDRHEWTDVGIRFDLERSLKYRREIDNGQDGEDMVVSAVFSPLSNLALVIDSHEIKRELYGNLTANAHFIDDVAHELTHSSFAHTYQRDVTVEGDAVMVETTGGIGSFRDVTLHGMDSNLTESLGPIWIDEAHAVHTGADVRVRRYPRSVPRFSALDDTPAYGPESTVISPKYLMKYEKLGYASAVGGGIAGEGYDILVGRKPQIHADITALQTGIMPTEVFTERLKHAVGEEIFTEITEPRPYTRWGHILQLIEQLPHSPSNET